MTIDWVALIEGGIPVLAGLYATALGYGWIKTRSQPESASQKWVRHFRWLGPLLVVFGVILGWAAHQRASSPSAQRLAADIAAKLELPVQVDEATRLDAIAGSGSTITYRYTVTTPIEPANVATFEGLLREQTRTAACSDPGFTQILRAGYTVELRYALTEPAREIAIVTTPASCSLSPPGS